LKSSLSSYLYLNYSLEDAIRKIAVAGFDAVDIWGGRPHAYRNDLREHDIRNIRILIDDLGLEIASFIPAQRHYPISLCNPLNPIRYESVHYIQNAIETAARLDAPIISVCPGHTLHNQDLDDGWERLADSLQRICEFAGHYEVLIALKPSDRYQSDLINTTIQAMDMIDQLGCDNLGVVFDTGHALLAGENTSSAIVNLGDRLFHLHLHDNDGQQDQHLIPGRGKFDFNALIHALRLAMFEGFLSTELDWTYTLDPDAAAIETQEYLERLINS